MLRSTLAPRFACALALALALALAAARPVRADTLADVHARGELIWGGDKQGGEPYAFEDVADPTRLIGFEVEIADELARRLGVRARFQQYAWSNLVPGLERGDFDIALNGLEATSERQERVLLSRPYYSYGEVLAVKRGAPYRSLDDLARAGKTVATLNQSYAFDLLRDRGIRAALYEGVEEPYLDLENGKVDGVLLDDVIATRYGCGRAGVTCLPDEVARGTYVVLLRKGDVALGAALDAALAGMVRDRTLEAILRKWKLWDARQESAAPEPVHVVRSRAFGKQQLLLFAEGALVTLELSVFAFLLAVPLGFLLAIARVFGRGPARIASAIYVEIFRGTPALLQLYVIYFALGPVLKLSALSAAILGLGLNYAAYEAEIYRGALLAVPRGQTEAAHAVGMSGWQTLRHVLLPQAFRIALPPMTNDFIALLKDSSLVGVIAVVELTKRMSIAAVDLRSWVLPGLVCAAFYFAMSFPLSRLARMLEKRSARLSGGRA
ncbi:MAG: transporter substrate-binding domain-containing protein [Myxococcales bacterium]|nr:transporter substrate-binding domain-containing protein [Myxococcales bacterium]